VSVKLSFRSPTPNEAGNVVVVTGLVVDVDELDLAGCATVEEVAGRDAAALHEARITPASPRQAMMGDR
jgi:hypothetical protein